jgi:hypothetical protein
VGNRPASREQGEIWQNLSKRKEQPGTVARTDPGLAKCGLTKKEKEGPVKSITLAGILLAGLMISGCQKKANETDNIRAGIMRHLSSLNTLNLDAMDMSITNVNIQGNQATAMVEFRPKNGAPSGAGMQVSYALEKQGSEWVVVKNEAIGGSINHPPPGSNPHMLTNSPGSGGNSSGMPDLLHPGTSNPNGALPPGHPPVNPGTNSGASYNTPSTTTKQP